MNKTSPKRFGGISFYIILILVFLLMAYFFSQGGSNSKKLTLSESLDILQEGEGTPQEVVLSSYNLSFTYVTKEGTKVTVKNNVPPTSLDRVFGILMESKEAGKIESFEYTKPVDISGYVNIILLVLMIGALGFFLWFTLSKAQGEGRNAMSFGKSRAKLNDPTTNKITFDDVAGADEEKEELTEVVDFLKNPKKYSELGAKIPRGIMLFGAPGTGKTLLAKAVAGEAGVPFFSISGSDFVEMFVGVGASRVRDLFENAKKNSPCIIFIDEIDAVGRHRGAGMGGGHDEREQTLNQLLVEMDGFGPNEGVIVIAATNRMDILDPALLRPGRFDRRVIVMRPDIKGREAILKVHSKNKPLASDVNLREIAKITPGFTGADLANLLNEAALLAARKNQKTILYEDISEAVFKIMIGPEKKSRVISEKERILTAYHEAGHAIVLREISDTDKVERVSIIPAGGAGGYTAHKPHEDVYYATTQQLIHNIMISLGGRAAEQIKLGEISTGASSDLQHCASIARDMVTKYGMSSRLGNVVFGSDDEVFLGKDYGHVQNYSEKVAAIIDDEVQVIVDKAYTDVLDILAKKDVILETLSKRLLEKEKIDGEEFEAIFTGKELDTYTKPLSSSNSIDSEGLLEPGFLEDQKVAPKPTPLIDLDNLLDIDKKNKENEENKD